uniref:Pheromone binding protein 2 n=1 Tax=Ectropis obliqua TaxID=248899 RepID=A0A1S6M473_ECTOB|nr:pheromone binding protein 2 [Ectropis obliqua]QJI08331.1 pheromone binding protein 2b [Ectropis obliqua]
MTKLKELLLVLVISVITRVQSSQDVMKSLTLNFGKPMEVCKKELDLPDAVTKEFLNFWREGYEVKNRLTGCAIICMSEKLELLDEGLKLHHGNAKEFAKKHGADDGMAQQLVDMIHSCMESTPPNTDPCLKTVDVAMCFKLKIHDLSWNPDPDLIIAEVLAEA